MDDYHYGEDPKTIDENVARLNALMVLILAIIFIFSNYKFALVILVFDFFVRVFAHPRYAPTSYFSRYILHSFNVKPRPVFAPPKLFAAKMALCIALLAFILYIGDQELASFIVCGFLAIFSALEASFRFCIGCWAYSYFSKLFGKNKEHISE